MANERNLLIVDDESNVIKSLKRELMGERYNIFEACDGESGLEILRGKNIGVILSDQRMPGMDGLTFLRKAKTVNPNAVQIILTGYGTFEHALEAINQLKAFGYLTKPWSSSALKSTIASAFAYYELTAENIKLLGLTFDVNEQLKNENNRLEEKVRDIATQLSQAQKLEAIGTLAGGIAHDFNNILSIIVGYTELALVHPTEEERKKDLGRVLAACERAKGLINQILTFCRRRDQERRPLEISLIIKEALKLMQAILPATITIHSEINSHESKVLADPTQVHQILMNLCTNAVHAMKDKGGVLRICLSEAFIEPQTRPPGTDLAPGPYIQLLVSDTGHGIDPAILDRIYDPFFTTKREGEGTGLGLSAVSGIVKSYGGGVTVQSQRGKGTTFVVYLPRFETTIPFGDGGDEKNVIPKGSERILFVDDEDHLSEMGGEMLQSLGYAVVSKKNSTDALETFQSHPNEFDMVITDMTMPSMTGIELSRKIMAIRPDIPIILCAGYSDFIDPIEAHRLGIREFLMKPFFTRELAGTVRRVLDHRIPEGTAS